MRCDWAAPRSLLELTLSKSSQDPCCDWAAPRSLLEPSHYCGTIRLQLRLGRAAFPARTESELTFSTEQLRLGRAAFPARTPPGAWKSSTRLRLGRAAFPARTATT